MSENTSGEFERWCNSGKTKEIAEAAYKAMRVFCYELGCNHRHWMELEDWQIKIYIDRVIEIGHGANLASLHPQSPALGIFDNTVMAMMRAIGVRS